MNFSVEHLNKKDPKGTGFSVVVNPKLGGGCFGINKRGIVPLWLLVVAGMLAVAVIEGVRK